jgi:hypothetical protein
MHVHAGHSQSIQEARSASCGGLELQLVHELVAVGGLVARPPTAAHGWEPAEVLDSLGAGARRGN